MSSGLRQLKRSTPSSARSPYTVEAAPDVAYWGPPGTGKTTTLMRVIEGELRSGVAVDRIGGFTYRRDMADEFAERAAETSGEEGEWFKTTHAACFSLLDMTKEQTCDAAAREQFCDIHGYDHSGSLGDDGTDDDGPSNSKVRGEGRGAALFKARDWCVDLGLPIHKWRVAPLTDDERRGLSDSVVARFNREYEDWKAQEGLLDFADMLAGCVEQQLAPPIEVLIEDEFQDKTPLQVALYNVWAERADRVYVAGDPYQAIDIYKGTDPKFMRDALDMAHEKEVLDKSYRLGADIVDYAERVLSAGQWEMPEVEPALEANVERIWWDEYADRAAAHEDDDVFHLARANYMKDAIAAVLGSAGIPFEDSRSRGARWTTKQRDLYNGVCRAVATIEDMSFGQEPTFDLSKPETRRVAEALPGSALTCAKKDAEDAVDNGQQLHDLASMAALGSLLSGNPFRGIEKRDDGSLVPSRVGNAARLADAFDARDGRPITEVSHTLSTIHAAKGREAPVVFLTTGSTYSILNDTPLAEEALVWYVGVTRAAGTLYLVHDHPQTTGKAEVLP